MAGKRVKTSCQVYFVLSGYESCYQHLDGYLSSHHERKDNFQGKLNDVNHFLHYSKKVRKSAVCP
jgi:hypothetical protein